MSTHVILRSRIEVVIANQERTPSIRDQINRLVEQQVPSLLERYFSHYVPHDVVLHIDQLVINVGTLHTDALQDQFIRQIEQTLRPVLQEQVSKVLRNPTPHTLVPLPEAILQAIAHYLSEGTMAWWMTQNDEKEIQQQYAILYATHPFQLEHMWHTLPKKEQAVQRFATRFAAPIVEQTVGLLCKQPLHQLSPLLKEIRPLLQQTGLLSTHNAYQSLLATALLGAIQHKQAIANRMDFVTLVLQRIAAKKSIDCGTVVAKLLRAYNNQQTKGGAALQTATLLPTWLQHLHEQSILTPRLVRAATQDTKHFIQQLDHLGEGRFAPHQLGATIRNMERQLSNPTLRHLLNSWLKEPCNRIRLTKELPQPFFSAFIAAVDLTILPLFTDFIHLLSTTTPSKESLKQHLQAIQEATLAYCAGAYTQSSYATAVHHLLKTQCNDPATSPSSAPPWINRLVSLAHAVGNNVQTKTEVETILLETLLACPLLEQLPMIACREHLSQLLERPSVAYKLQQIAALPHATTQQAALMQLLHGLCRSVIHALPWPPSQATDGVSLPPHIHAIQPSDTLDAKTAEACLLAQPSFKQKWESIEQQLSTPIDNSQKLLEQSLLPVVTEGISLLTQHAYMGLLDKISNATNRASKKTLLLAHLIERVLSLLQTAEGLDLVQQKQTALRTEATLFFAERHGKKQLLELVVKIKKVPIEQLDQAIQALAVRAAVAIQPKHLLPQIVEKKVLAPIKDVFSLENVIDFLVHDQLPPDKPVPSYLIAKSIIQATPALLMHQLAPICQEVTLLRKLLLHATEATVTKLMDAWVPFSSGVVETVATILLQADLSPAWQPNQRLVHELLIRAALCPPAPATETDYLQRVVHHLHAHARLTPAALCTRLATCARQHAYGALEPFFALLQKRLALLNATVLEQLDLRLLPLHEAVAAQIGPDTLPQYYNQVVPALEALVHHPNATDTGYPILQELVAKHLPMLSAPLQQTICRLLAAGLVQESPQKCLYRAWEHFLYTGSLGSYATETALFQSVMQHPPVPFFAQAVQHVHVRQRLIARFSHAQLLQLVQKQTGDAWIPYLTGCHALWGATKLADEMVKQPFWEAVLALLPTSEAFFDVTDWTNQLLEKLSIALHIPSVTLLQSFVLLSKETPSVSDAVRTTLHALQQQADHQLQQEANQQTKKTAVLGTLHLLLQGRSFAETSDTLVQTLEPALCQLMAQQPELLRNMLVQQLHKVAVARRLVYYLSEPTCTQIVSILAQPHAALALAYCNLVQRIPVPAAMRRRTFDQWKREWRVALLTHLLHAECIEPSQLLHSPWKQPFTQEHLPTLVHALHMLQPNDPTEERVLQLVVPIIEAMESNRLLAFPRPTVPAQSSPLGSKTQPSVNVVTKKKQLNTSESDKAIRLYTQNTGLVFLWPFLYDFFKGHHMLIGNRFVDEQAAHNAVYLLHYTATGSICGPEWQFVLPKLLCGLSYDTVLLPYLPMHTDDAFPTDIPTLENEPFESEEPTNLVLGEGAETPLASLSMAPNALPLQEQQALDLQNNLLFEKAFKRWKGLANLKKEALFQEGITPSTFKSYFLHRLGILVRHACETPNTYFWHLTLMHQVYDNATLLPPWSMDKIKLPWMTEALVLFWMPG